MVRDILAALKAPLQGMARPISGLHQAAYLLAALTLASQVLALLRDRLFAHTFGAGQTLDLYYAAFRVPDLVFTLVASLVSAYVLIPLIAGNEKKEAREILSQSATFLIGAGGLGCAVLAFFAPQLLALLYPTLMSSVAASEFVFAMRLLLIQPILLGLSSILSSVTQSKRKFFLFALSPVLYNLGIIGGTVFLYPVHGLPGIAVGVVLGAVLHLLVHVPVVLGAGLAPRPVMPQPAVIASIIAHSLPRSMALGMASIIALALSAIASRIGTGAVAVFALAGNLAAVPLSLIGVSYATAAFPVLAEHAQAKRDQEFKATIATAARHIIFWSSIITVIGVVLRAHIVRIVLGSGAFDWDATRLTAAVLAVLLVGLTAQGITLLAARAFYATKRSWNPFFIQLGDIGVSIVVALTTLSLAQVHPEFRYFMEALLRVVDVPNTGVLFVALGATVGQLLVCAVALLTLGAVAPGVARSIVKPLFDGFGAAILGGAAAYVTLSLMGNLGKATTLTAVFTEGAIAAMVGFAVAGVVLLLLENREMRELYRSLRRLKPVSAIFPQGAEADV